MFPATLLRKWTPNGHIPNPKPLAVVSTPFSVHHTRNCFMHTLQLRNRQQRSILKSSHTRSSALVEKLSARSQLRELPTT
jgi:hypothetical protein